MTKRWREWRRYFSRSQVSAAASCSCATTERLPVGSRRAGAGNSRCCNRFAPLQHLDRLAGAGGAGGAGGAWVAAVVAGTAAAEPALAGGDGDRVAGVAVRDRGAAAGAADGGAAVHRQRAAAVALAGGDAAGGAAGPP